MARLARAPDSGTLPVLVAGCILFGATGTAAAGGGAAPASASAAPLAPQVLVEQASAQLRAVLEPDYDRVELRPLDRLLPVPVPVGVVALSTRVHPWAPGRHRARVDVDVTVAGRRVRTVPVWFEVQAYSQGWLAASDLPAGHVVQAGDLFAGLADVAGQGAPGVLPSPVGARLRRAVPQGRALTAAALESTPWVRRQAPVVLELRNAAFVIESSGVALADGRAGDVVQVRLGSTPEIVRGRVVAPGRLAY